MADLVDQLNARKLPFAALLGIQFVSADLDRVVAELRIRDDLCTRPEIAHGGVVMAFADTLGAAGTILNLPDGATTTTIESKTNFLRGAPLGSVITGAATPVHRGRTTQVWQTTVRTEDGKTAAIVTQTQMVLMPRD